jgi:hypothetical protein
MPIDPAATCHYYLHDSSTSFRLQLSGDLSGDTVRDVEQAWHTACSTIGGRQLVVDITGLRSMDEKGRQLIENWRRQGAVLVAGSGGAKDHRSSAHWVQIPRLLFGRRNGRSARSINILMSLLDFFP